MKNLVAAFAFVLALAGCGGGDSTGPSPFDAAVGSYQLTQVNGSTVPMVYYQSTAGTIEVLSGSMSLRSDHSYTQTLTLKATYSDGTSETVPTVENGSFNVTGSQITFTIPASGTDPAFSYTGAVDNGVVTYTYEGDSFRYEK